jgi:hypothetical protein
MSEKDSLRSPTGEAPSGRTVYFDTTVMMDAGTLARTGAAAGTSAEIGGAMLSGYAAVFSALRGLSILLC